MQLLVMTSKWESLGVPAPWSYPKQLWGVHSIVFDEYGAKVIVKTLKICPYPLESLSPNAEQNWWADEEVVVVWLPVLGHLKNGLCLPHSLDTLRDPGYCITRIQAIMRHGQRGGGGDWDLLYAASKNSPDMWVSSLGKAESWDDDQVPANTFVSPDILTVACERPPAKATWPWHSRNSDPNEPWDTINVYCYFELPSLNKLLPRNL